jgi:hypothetical protein
MRKSVTNGQRSLSLAHAVLQVGSVPVRAGNMHDIEAHNAEHDILNSRTLM